MKRVRLALGVVAVLSLFSSALTARSTPRAVQSISGCTAYCRDVCIANGDPCCNLGPNLCACC